MFNNGKKKKKEIKVNREAEHKRWRHLMMEELILFFFALEQFTPQVKALFIFKMRQNL